MSNPRAPALKFQDWPAGDQTNWKQMVQPGGLFDDQGPAAHWAASTQYCVRHDYGIWLAWCKRQHILVALAPHERVTPENVRQYIEALQARVAPVTLHTYLARLHRVIALWYPQRDWRWFKQVVNRLERLKVPARDKAGRLQDSGRLLSLGHELMASAPLPESVPAQAQQLKAAIQYRDGLMLALLSSRPLRRTNFADLQLGEQL